LDPGPTFQTPSYARELGIQAAPHDLRRTFAKLAHKGRAAVEQIQLSLGHATILTTERHLGVPLRSPRPREPLIWQSRPHCSAHQIHP